jgi:hypothetical protein
VLIKFTTMISHQQPVEAMTNYFSSVLSSSDLISSYS